MMVELEYELQQALCGMTPEHAAKLRAAGIDGEMPIGRSRIVAEGGRYNPWGDVAHYAFILPIRIDWLQTPETTRGIEAVRSGYLVDLLAFHPARPDRWALRLGVATWLGSIAPQNCNPDPVRVWRTPLRWLQADCDGLCLLMKDAVENYRILSGCRSIMAEDEIHARELRRILERPWAGPEVRHAA
jgi:hypothetical protein